MTPLAAAPLDNSTALVRFVTDWGKQNGLLRADDHIVLISGTGTPISEHNMIVVRKVE